jgi:hypothetical protein
MPRATHLTWCMFWMICDVDDEGSCAIATVEHAVQLSALKSLWENQLSVQDGCQDVVHCLQPFTF